MGVNLPLNLVPEMEEKSVLFRAMPRNIRNILLTESVTANYHGYVLIHNWNPLVYYLIINVISFLFFCFKEVHDNGKFYIDEFKRILESYHSK